MLQLLNVLCLESEDVDAVKLPVSEDSQDSTVADGHKQQ